MSMSTAAATSPGTRRRRSTRFFGCSAELLDALLDVAAQRRGHDLGDLRLDLAADERDVHLQVALDHEGDVAVTGKQDRKSTRLNSSHSQISYAVFCLKKKKKTIKTS